MPPHIAAGDHSKVPLAGEGCCKVGVNVKMVKPLTKPNIIKKRTKPFKRHQTDRKICVKVDLYLLSDSKQQLACNVASC